MVSAKRIAQLTKKWQRVASLRRRLTMAATKEVEGCSTAVAGKGHYIMYTTDGGRIEVPLPYFGSMIFRELLIAQDEFGFISNKGITLPCDTTEMEYIKRMLGRNASAEVQKAFFSSMVMPCHYASCVAPSLGVNQQMAVCCS